MHDLVYWLYKLSRFLYLIKIPILSALIKIFIRIFFYAVIPYTAKIGKGTKIAYGGLGTVIHARCVIGENCMISSGVTIGGTSLKYEVPKIGNNVLVGTGAKILGPVIVGDNSVIGANAVVLKDVPANSVVAGIPATIIKKNIDISNYMQIST